MKNKLKFGSRVIEYSLFFKERKTLGIKVHPDGKVEVNAPINSQKSLIQEKLLKKSPWIIKQIDYFSQYKPAITEKKYVSGESHQYLGRQYRLKVRKSLKNEVHYKGREIWVFRKPAASVKVLLNDWYRRKAHEKFESIAEPIIARFEKYKVTPKGIYIQNMKTRWGSCTPSGKILLNPELIKKPKMCVEYVIVHELCHLVHHSHDKNFFRLLEKEMPGWEKWKERLESSN